VKRLIWIAVTIGALALLGCGGESEDEPQEFVATQGEDAYQTAVFASQRAKWLALAEQGDARSQRQLGIMYYLGQGTEKDYTVAHDWLIKAADQGDDIAQMSLGVMNRKGHGVPQDNTRAHMWFSLSAQQGNPSAAIHLEELTPSMSSEQLDEARKLAEEWKPKI
jgi:TPR repeat protein